MGSQVCRQGDATEGFCKACRKQVGGKIMSASENVKVNQRGVARQDDIVMSMCGHLGNIKARSVQTEVNQRAIATVGDIFTGTYTGILKNGSENVTAG